jgi:ABC-type nitrate/sulfonate/bicarbonate transport system substrate-binding protein
MTVRYRVVLLALALVLVGTPATSQTGETITVAFPTVDPGSEPLYAAEMGFFQKAGLNVTLEPLANGGAIASGVASGSIDIGLSNVIAIETAHQKGIPFVVVAPGSDNIASLPSNVLIVAKNSPLQKASDLNGKIIATTPLHGIGDLLISAWIDKNGGDSSTVKFIEIPFPQAEAVVTQGRADASLSVEPFITQAKADTRIFGNVFAVLDDGYLITAFFANASWAQAHPALIARFAAAVRQTADWANKNQAKSAEILAKYAKVDPDVVKQTIRSHYATTLTAKQLQATIDTAAHYKYLDGAFPASDIIFQPK